MMILARLDSARIPPALAMRTPFAYHVNTMGFTRVGPRNRASAQKIPFTALKVPPTHGRFRS
jgi:hypothetical protein